MHKALSMLLLAVGLAATTASAQDDWTIEYERSNFLRTDRYDQTIAFCQRLAEYSPVVRYESFGISPQGRDIPLLIVDQDQEFDPNGERTRNKVIVLIQAGIHSGEIEGKDAGLMLIRDMIINKKLQGILDNGVLLFIPIFSVDAHERFGPFNRINQNGPEEMGWRSTAQNLNLNRDFMKTDAPEIQAWLRLFNKWLPDVLTDIHTTDGADFQYVITYVADDHPGVAEPLRSWTANDFVPELKVRMKSSGYDLFPYVSPRIGHDIRSGLESRAFPPRFSNGYGTAQSRPFVLIETHMLKPYKQRVESVYEYLRHLIAYCGENSSEIKEVMRKADSLTASYLAGTYLPVDFELSKDSVMIDFAGVDFRVEDSRISGSKKIVWGTEPVNFRVPLFNQNIPSDSALIPHAYLIPREWDDVIERIRLHGLTVNRLTEPTILEVVSSRLSKPQWQSSLYEGRQTVKFEIQEVIDSVTFPAGTAVVIADQRGNRVLAQLLEPNSRDSFVRWGFFNAIFEQKEYAEDYVMEEVAQRMLAESTSLRNEFETKLQSDSTFAKSPAERLNFFYERSPYWDQNLGLYPVRKVMGKVNLPLE